MEAPQKTEIELAYDPSIPLTPGHIPEGCHSVYNKDITHSCL
jgi:hypothetical protein